MNESKIFRPELRISPKPVLVALVGLGQLLALGAQISSYPYKVVERTMWLFLLICVLSTIGWLCVNWKPLAGRWFAVSMLVAVVHLAAVWLGIPQVLTLSTIATALAAALISLPAATVTAMGQSLLFLVVLRYPVVGLDSPTATVALAAIWATLGVMYAVYHPVHELNSWLEEYFGRAQQTLEETRERRAELAQALDDMVHANRQLALANERTATWRSVAEEAQKAKTMFVAKVSHEFRTPLNMIIGLVNLMVETPEIYAVTISPEMRKDLKIVHRNCEHLASMISDVLNLTQMEAGRLTLHKERIDLGETIDAAVESVHPLIEKKGLFLQTDIPEDLSQVYCDRTRIQQVVLNLVSNAARFTQEGGISIRVAQQTQHVVVSVTDTGPGISPEDAKRIFEPFCQGTSNLWRDTGGSGLGLTISKQFVELHGGQMSLESELGVGTTFSFSLPVSEPAPHIARPGRWIKEDWVWVQRMSKTRFPNSHYRPRVVVCDETDSLYPEFMRYSDEVEFVDTRDLVQAVQELQECPAHALVLNAAAPDSLPELVEAAREEAPGTPIIGCSVARSVARTVEAGALGYLIKPIIRADLEGAIRAVGEPVRQVLVVDDDPDVLRLFTRMLHTCDETLSVVTASSGAQALHQIRCNPPDLVLLDVMMPDMDGWQVLEQLHQDSVTVRPTIFLVSARDPTERPPKSKLLLATIGEGLSTSQLLRCSLALSEFFLTPEGRLDPGPPQTAGAGPALAGKGQHPASTPSPPL